MLRKQLAVPTATGTAIIYLAKGGEMQVALQFRLTVSVSLRWLAVLAYFLMK